MLPIADLLRSGFFPLIAFLASLVTAFATFVAVCRIVVVPAIRWTTSHAIVWIISGQISIG